MPHSDTMRVLTYSASVRRSLAGFTPLVLIAGCVAPTRVATPPPTPRAAPPAPAPRPTPLAADWRDWPYTPGTWTYRREAGGSIASFGPRGAAPVLTLRCDNAGRRVYLTRASTAATPLTIRTSSVTRAVAVQPAGATVTAALASTDPLLEAMGFSRGRFVIAQPGTAPLVIPAWAEIERVTEDCRG